MSVKSKHSSKKSKNGKKEKKKKIEDSDEDIESSEEELDLTKECHPIRHYMNDRAEMINQMFSVIKGNKLKAMLPPILKDCDIDQLKLQCLDQLLGMSEKRITCILEGETLETSSESEVVESDEVDDTDEKNGTTSGSSSDRSDDSQDDRYINNVGTKSKKRKSDATSDGRSGKVSKTESDNAPPEQGKTLLEILELEMRARAIRALLKQSGNEKVSELLGDDAKVEEVNKSEAQEVSGEVVDLTECEDEEFPPCLKKETPKETEIDKKVMTFEAKVEKSHVEKANSIQEGEKSKRLQAELELRNKLFKKKIYRTRQQRMENDEEEKVAEKTENEKEKLIEWKKPSDPTAKTVEDPEEGEINTSEDEFFVEVKQEVIESEESHAMPDFNEFQKKVDEDVERISAIDNGNFISNSNVENRMEVDTNTKEDGDETVNKAEDVNESVKVENGEDKSPHKPEPAPEPEPENEPEPEPEDETERESEQVAEPEPEPEPENSEGSESNDKIEETSWRDRWLQKDGVQKLVKSSKILTKVKKRIAEKSQRAKEEVPGSVETNSDSNSNSKLEVVEGSIKEYEMLFGRQVESESRESESFLDTTPSGEESLNDGQQTLTENSEGS